MHVHLTVSICEYKIFHIHWHYRLILTLVQLEAVSSKFQALVLHRGWLNVTSGRTVFAQPQVQKIH